MKRYRFQIAILLTISISLILSTLSNKVQIYGNNDSVSTQGYEYTVQPHESLSVIADNTRPPNVRFNTWLDEIEFVNGMDKNTIIYPGEMIKIPEAK